MCECNYYFEAIVCFRNFPLRDQHPLRIYRNDGWDYFVYYYNSRSKSDMKILTGIFAN